MNRTVNFAHQSFLNSMDVVQEAEDMGLSRTGSLGFAISIGQQRREDAIDRGDTTIGDSIERFLGIAKRIGFEVIYTETFKRSADYAEGREDDTLYVMKHPTSHSILCMESHTWSDGQVSVNQAELYCVLNVGNVPSSMSKINGHCFSGGFESATHPKWRGEEQFFKKLPDGSYKSSFPEDILYNMHTYVRQNLVSIHAAVMSMNPVKRPVSEVFEISEAFGISEDYEQGKLAENGLQKVNRYDYARKLRDQRMRNSGAVLAHFGFAN